MRSSRRDPERRAWLLAAAVAVVAAVATRAASGLPGPQGPVTVPWPLLIPLVYVAEVTMVHIHFRRNSHSFSMSEIPLVVGLFFTPPLGLIAAQLIGNALALGITRAQRPLKLAFNLSQFTLQTALALLAFHAIVGDREPLGPAGWIGTLTAMALAVVIANILINGAIDLSGGRIDRSEQLRVLSLGLVAATMNAALGLLAITVIWTRPEAAWTGAVPPAILFVAYRAYTSQRRERRRLQGLYEATRALQGAASTEALLETAADQARALFQAERAAITHFPADGDGFRTCIGPGDEPPTTIRVRAGEPAPPDKARLQRRGRRHQTMTAPLRGPAGTHGAIEVAEPMGDVQAYGAADLRFLEALAAQISVTLENGHLGDSVARLTESAGHLRRRALHDPLTGVANRSLFQERLAAALAGSATRPCAVLFIDLDEFKAVNDTMGHGAGDELLVAIAQRLQSCCRPWDTVARVGGDEFAILLEQVGGPDDAARVAERVNEVLARPLEVAGRGVAPRASVGVALASPGADADALLRNADADMYRAKEARGTFAVFGPETLVPG